MLKIVLEIKEDVEEVRKELERVFVSPPTVVEIPRTTIGSARAAVIVKPKVIMAKQNAVIKLEKRVYSEDYVTTVVHAFVCMNMVESIIGICTTKKCINITIEPIGSCPYECVRE